jgi:hypothetical protein
MHLLGPHHYNDQPFNILQYVLLTCLSIAPHCGGHYISNQKASLPSKQNFLFWSKATSYVFYTNIFTLSDPNYILSLVNIDTSIVTFFLGAKNAPASASIDAHGLLLKNI